MHASGKRARAPVDALDKRCRVWWPARLCWQPATVTHWSSTMPGCVQGTADRSSTGSESARRGWFLIVLDSGEHEWTQLPCSSIVIGTQTQLPSEPKTAPAQAQVARKGESADTEAEARALSTSEAERSPCYDSAGGAERLARRARDDAGPGLNPPASASAAAPPAAVAGESVRGERGAADARTAGAAAAASQPRSRHPPQPRPRPVKGAARRRAPADGSFAERLQQPKAVPQPPLSPIAAWTDGLSTPSQRAAVPEVAAETLARAEGRSLGGERRSSRVRHVGDPADSAELKSALSHLERVWRGAELGVEERALTTDARGIVGLHVCAAFLSADEARALRLVFAAHKAWSQYIYGSALAAETRGSRPLDSVLQRIDFGPAGCFPEGVAATHSPMWPLDGVRARLLELLAARVQRTFGELLPWPTVGAKCGADMMQLTQMRPREELAPHVDSRDRWGEGIASIAWGQGAGAHSPLGEPWTLCMRRGRGRAAEDSIDIALPGGACYIITRGAQGRTEHCAAGKLAHQWCTCCWQHGVQTNPKGLVTRQSVTIRCYAQRPATLARATASPS